MRLSIFNTMTNPKHRGDNWNVALDCFTDLADEVIIVDGGEDKAWLPWLYPDDPCMKECGIKIITQEWPYDFDWLQISRAYQKGYENCTGDWALFADLDFLFHENHFEMIKETFEKNPNVPALSFYKYQFVLPDRYNIKSRRVIAINKRLVGDRVKMDGGGDLCQTTLDGKHLTPDDVPEAGIPFYNYEKILKTKEQIIDDVKRMEKAYKAHFGTTQYGDAETDEGIFERWFAAQKGKFNKPQKMIQLEEHPKYIQETIKNLRPEQWGYNGFGLIEGSVYGI